MFWNTENSKEAFQQKLEGIKGVFTQSLSNAKALKEEILKKEQEKKAQASAIMKEVLELEKTRDSTQKFIENLEKFV